MKMLKFRNGVSGVALIASGLVIGAPAFAQDASSAGKPALTAKDDGNAIVVTGLRGSLATAIKTKRYSETVMDSISAQDIGALPDRTVSEALQRLPGVTLQRTGDVNTLEGSDPGRVPAEGGGVFVRGLSWTLSELNGNSVFSANSGRAINFDDIAPDLMGGVDVYKNPSADMIEGSIAGIVDMRTRKPLDSKGFFAISADWNYADIRKKGFWSGNAVFSHHWDVDGTEVGLLLSASTGETGNRTNAIQTGAVSYATLGTAQSGLAAGTQVELPTSLGYRSVDWTQKRRAYDAVFQVRPASNFVVTFEGTIAKTTPQDLENAVQISDSNYGFGQSGGVVNNSSLQFGGPNNALTSGTFPNAILSLDTRSGQEDYVTRDYTAHAKWDVNDHLTVNVDVDHVASHASVYSMTAFDGFGGNPSNGLNPTVAFNLAGNTPKISITPAAGTSLSTQSDYFWQAAMDHNEADFGSSWAERADATYSFDKGGFLKSIGVGFRATDKNLLTQTSSYNWGLLSNDFTFGGTPVSLGGAPTESSYSSFSKFLGGGSGVSGGWFPTAGLVSNGTANAYKFLQTTESAGWGWAPLGSGEFNSTAGASTAYGTNVQEETTYAGYLMAKFGHDSGFLGHFDGNVGVRIVHTSNTASGDLFLPSLVNSSGGVLTAAACTAKYGATACQGLTNALQFAGAGAETPIVASSGYTNVLPSLNLRFYLKKDVLMRLAVSRGIYRPGFTDLEANQTFSFNFTNQYEIQSQTLTGGNPYLKPITATNFDASFEYYYGRANTVAVALFYKTIQNYITDVASNVVTSTLNGVTESFASTTPVNAGHGTLGGVEVNYEQFFDRLPGALSGLGVSANYTFITSSGGETPTNTQAEGIVFAGNLPLQGLSKNAINAALLYEKHGVSARLAYNWRSEYMANANGANVNQPVWMEAYGQLDGSVFFDVNRYAKLGFQVTNVTGTRTYIDVGPAAFHPRYAWEQSDRHFAVLLRSKF